MLGWEDNRPLQHAIGAKRAARLAKKPGLKTYSDALTTYPQRYARMGSAHALDTPEIDEYYTCVADILHTEKRENHSRRGPRTYLKVVFSDGHHIMETTLFGKPRMHEQVIAPGARLLLYGKVGVYRNQYQLKNPSYVTINPGEKAQFGAFGPLETIVEIAGGQAQAQRLLSMAFLPGYPRKAGTSTAELIGVMDHVLRSVEHIPEMLPRGVAGAPQWPADNTGQPLVDFDTALRHVHQPPESGPEAARQRLKFNEALELQLVMALRRSDATHRAATPIPAPGPHTAAQGGAHNAAQGGAHNAAQGGVHTAAQGGVHTAAQPRLVNQLLGNLPYTLSDGQQAAWRRLATALDSDTPASLMLQGDVGSGKTVVALLAMLAAADAGLQSAFIAPTEVLAVQHARTLNTLLEGMPVTITVLTGSQRTEVKRQALLDIVSGQAHIVIGTHALIQEGVEFFQLGLVVVDEQHRFGVHQRDKLRESAPAEATPHMLVMTATPIPRTVGMTMFGDLEAVRLPGLPAGRGSVRSAVVPAENPRWMQRMWDRVREEAQAGRQSYVVVPRIEGDNGVEAWAQRLQRQLAPLRVGMLHGRLSAEEKDQIMSAFSRRELDVLVATTVIEVGVDVPNATTMIIVDADRFGVSQLHQLRGRVGRGSADAWCLMHTAALPDSPSYERLTQVAATTDGFALAELDLRQRTEGDILGQDQAGARRRRSTLLDLVEDEGIIAEARRYATELVAFDEALARELVAGIELEDQDYIERS